MPKSPPEKIPTRPIQEICHRNFPFLSARWETKPTNESHSTQWLARILHKFLCLAHIGTDLTSVAGRTNHGKPHFCMLNTSYHPDNISLPRARRDRRSPNQPQPSVWPRSPPLVTAVCAADVISSDVEDVVVVRVVLAVAGEERGWREARHAPALVLRGLQRLPAPTPAHKLPAEP